MREIKFRAWDKITKKYFYSGTLDNGDVLVVHLDGEIEISSDDTYKPEDFIIEQFTGLRDKNGREIYEGDILKCSGHCDDNCVVYYAEMCACFIVLPYWKSYKDWCDDTEDDAAYYYLWDNIKLEIIGNIHENPELLEEQ